MKPLILANKRHSSKPGRAMAILTALLVGIACTGHVNAQENIQTETQLKLPAEQVEQLKQNEAIKKEQDNKAGAITPSDQKEKQSGSPGSIKGQTAGRPERQIAGRTTGQTARRTKGQAAGSTGAASNQR